MRVFVDSDVIISSQLSSRGAAALLLKKQTGQFYGSNMQLEELKSVCGRLKIDFSKVKRLVMNRLQVVDLGNDVAQIRSKWGGYTLDVDDAHVVAGAVKAKAKFLLSYNLRHFKIEKLRRRLDLVCLTPGQFLQYWRSRS